MLPIGLTLNEAKAENTRWIINEFETEKSNLKRENYWKNSYLQNFHPGRKMEYWIVLVILALPLMLLSLPSRANIK